MNNKIRLILLFLIFCTFFLNLSARDRHIVTGIYHKDYDLINRTVIVMTGKPDYSIEQRSAQRQINVLLENTTKGDNLPARQTLFSPVLESISISPTGRGEVLITINTKKQYYLEHFDIAGYEFRIVFDIYNKEKPENYMEELAFGKFYYTIGKRAEAEAMLRSVLASNPNITEANYYLGKILSIRGNISEAGERFRKVSVNDPEYIQAQTELMKMGLIDAVFTQDMERIFSNLQDNFLLAGDLNRQYLMLALTSSIFDDSNKAKTAFGKIDFTDRQTIDAVNNVASTFYDLRYEREFTPFKELVSAYTPKMRLTTDALILLILVVLITSLIAILITTSICRRKYRDVDFTIGEHAEVPVEEEPDESPSQETFGYSAEDEEPEKPLETGETEDFIDSEEEEEENVEEEDEEEKLKRIFGTDQEKITKEPIIDLKPEQKKVKKAKEPEVTVEPEPEPEKAKDIPDIGTQLALKLYGDGWNEEAIAKELKMDIIKVKQIILSNNEQDSE